MEFRISVSNLILLTLFYTFRIPMTIWGALSSHFQIGNIIDYNYYEFNLISYILGQKFLTLVWNYFFEEPLNMLISD